MIGNDGVICGYPESVGLRYLASTISYKEKSSKNQEKQFKLATLDEDFFRIKRNPLALEMNITSENYKDETCQTCFNIPEDQPYSHNYYVNLLNINALNLIFMNHMHSTDISKKVSKNHELLEFLKDCEKFDSINPKENDVRLLKYKTMVSWVKEEARTYAYCFWSRTFKCFTTTIFKIYSTFIQRLLVSSTEIEMITQANKQDVPIIYILKNQSYFDWFMVLCVLVFCKLKVPVTFLYKKEHSTWNWLYKKLGVIFIRPRRQDLHEMNPKYIVYDETWLINVEENLKASNHLMFYLNDPDEKHDCDLISAIMESVRRKAIKDALIVPISVEYEKKITEEDSHDGDSFFSVLDWIKKWQFGFVKVNFMKPFLIKELMSSLYGKKDKNIDDMTDTESYDLTPKVASHINYDLCNSHPLMATNLVSYLLLKKFRDGVKFNDLVQELDGLRNELRYYNKRLGFTGKSELVINHVIKLLGPKLVSDVTENDKDRLISPVLELPCALELTLYAEETMSHFMMRAVIFTSISVIFEDQFKAAFKNSDLEQKFTYDALLCKVIKLCDILQFEHAFKKSCRSLEDEFSEAFGNCCNDGFFAKFEKLMTEEERWGHRFAKHLEESDSYDDDDDYDYDENDYDERAHSPSPPKHVGHVASNSDTYLMNLDCPKSLIQEVSFYKNSLKTYLDAYAASAEHLSTLINTQLPDSYYCKKLSDKLKMMLDNKQLNYAESLSPNILKNSVRLFTKRKVILSYAIGNVKFLSLTKDYYNNTDALSSIVKEIQEYQ